jgi:hypothetical protein
MEIPMRILASILFGTFLASSVGCSDAITTDVATGDATDSVAASDSAADARVTCGSSCAADPSVCQAQIGGRAFCDPMMQTCECPP